MFYRIPSNLPDEIAGLDGYIAEFKAGTLDAAALKSRRVPFGCYEQRRDNTFMLRIRTTGGALTPAQLKVVAETSARFGAKSFHITTRQELQIHDLQLDNVTTAMRTLLAAGLATRGGGGNTIRNIMLSPDAGVSPREVFDPSPYAFALTTRLISQGDSWNLPRKLKISFANSEDDNALARFNDIGFLAKIENGVRGFAVYVAGGMGGKPEVGHSLRDFVPDSDVYIVAEAVKRLFDQHGNRKNRNMARLRFLWNKLGEEKFRELYAEEEAKLRAENPAPFVPEAPSSAVAAETIAPQPADGPEYEAWTRRFVEPQSQSGLYSVLVPVSLGNISNEDGIALADFLAPLGQDVVRATFGQNLRLRNIPEKLLGNVFHLVRQFDKLSAAPRLLANSISCTGADTCKLGICLPKGAMTAIVRHLSQSGLSLDDIPDFKLNISGCPNTCGQHMIADLGFFGNVGRKEKRIYPAYAVVAGARTAHGDARLAKVFDRVPSRALPRFVAEVLQMWLAKKDRYASFADYVDGEGEEDIKAAIKRHESVPDFEDDKNYYFDWGAENPFSLVGRGVGECSAGLFDLIDVDLKEADRLRAEGGDDGLPQLALRTARALLITRGIESGAEAQVFASFLKHFITGGLVAERFRPAIEAAKNAAPLVPFRDDLFALLDDIKSLYANMDSSLRFPAEKLKAPVAEAPVLPVAANDTPVALERDYRTVACPLNFVKVKFDLAKLSAGERLKVVLGDGDPIRNVPLSVAGEGHKVLSQTRVGDVWEVLIEKAG